MAERTLTRRATRVPLIDPVTLELRQACQNCRHFDPTGMPRCAAFPDRIPLPIVSGELPHDRPVPGDHGIRFEPIDWPAEVLDRERHPERYGG
jgi:hypothetical protein